jgi:hypothetical protein
VATTPWSMGGSLLCASTTTPDRTEHSQRQVQDELCSVQLIGHIQDTGTHISLHSAESADFNHAVVVTTVISGLQI